MNLFIYGAGGLGHEVLELSKTVHQWNSITFIDDTVTEDNYYLGIPIIPFKMLNKKLDEMIQPKDAYFAIAVGEPHLREHLYDKMIKLTDLIPISLVHPNSFIASNTKVGKGVIINYGSFVSESVVLEENVYLQPYSVVGHNSIIGNHSIISTFVSIGGNCKIDSNVFIGMNASVKQGISLGKYSIIGMGAVVHTSVEDSLVVVGNPARVIRKNESRRVFSN